MEQQEGNKIIAEFMGRQIVETPWPHKPIEEQGQWVYQLGSDFFKTKTKYHSSWDWLHPVINKIRDTVDKDDYDERKALEDELPIFGLTIFTDIKTVWWAVVEFIKWYNQNKK